MKNPSGMWLPALALSVALAWSHEVQAVIAMETTELASHCNLYDDPSAEADRIFCTRYVQGFIDGAVATDGRVAQNVVEELDSGENYSSRAAMTRIGKRLERFETTYAEFCLGNPIPLKEVVEHIVAALENEQLVTAHPLARDLVYTVLRSDYPCEMTD